MQGMHVYIGLRVSCPLAGAAEMFHQTRAASETLSALLGGDSEKRILFHEIYDDGDSLHPVYSHTV